jgi:hypothetical protein
LSQQRKVGKAMQNQQPEQQTGASLSPGQLLGNSQPLLLSAVPLSDWRGGITLINGNAPVTALPNATWEQVSNELRPAMPAAVAEQKLAPQFLPHAPSAETAAMLVVNLSEISREELYSALHKISEDVLTCIVFSDFDHKREDQTCINAVLVVPLDRPVNAEKYAAASASFYARYFGQADAVEANIFQPHPIWSCNSSHANQAEKWMTDGGVASADALLPASQEVPALQIEAEIAEQVSGDISATCVELPVQLAEPKFSSADPATPTPQTDEDVIATLAAMQPMDYDRVRQEHAKALGIQVKTLDAEVKKARNEDAPTSTNLPFAEVEPYPDPIDPAQVLDDIVEIIQRHIVLNIEQVHALTLWIALTWFIDVLEIAPLLIANSPEKSCGKTNLLTLVMRLSYRPLPASNASASAIFRAVAAWKPTILIDEADTFFRDNTELQGMVNAGYLRDGYVLRSEAVGDSFEPSKYSVFSMKALAGIALEKHLQDATVSRGIPINMRRKLPHESVSRLRHANNNLFGVISAKLARFTLDYSHQVRVARPVLPEALSDRDQDNWDGPLAIAGCAGPEWVSRATAAAIKLSGSAEKSASTANELLADIQSIFTNKRIAKISSVDMIEALCDDPELGWATYNRGKPLSPRQLAKQLAPYGITSKTVRMGVGNTPKGYDAAQFADAFARYLATAPSDSNTQSASENLPPRRNVSTESMPSMKHSVADKTQQATLDAPQGEVAATGHAADVAPQTSIRNASATRDPLLDFACGGVADELAIPAVDASAVSVIAAEDAF